MSVDQERVGDVLADHAGFVHIHVVDIVNQVDSFALTGVCGLDNPNVFLALMLLQLLIVIVKVAELIGQDVRVWYKVKWLFAETLLHAHHVKAKAVFACNFMALWEVINFLVLVQTLVLVRFAGARTPEQVPLVGFRVSKPVAF